MKKQTEYTSPCCETVLMKYEGFVMIMSKPDPFPDFGGGYDGEMEEGGEI